MRGRTISSLFTLFHKTFWPFVLAAGLFICVPLLFFSEDNKSACIVFTIFVLFLSFRQYLVNVPLKRVRLEDGYLLISNYSTIIEVPISEVQNVLEITSYTSPHPKDVLGKYLYRRYSFLLLRSYRIFIIFENPTKFGKWIMFIPRIPRRLSSYVGDHEIVKELKDLAGIVTQDS